MACVKNENFVIPIEI